QATRSVLHDDPLCPPDPGLGGAIITERRTRRKLDLTRRESGFSRPGATVRASRMLHFRVAAPVRGQGNPPGEGNPESQPAASSGARESDPQGRIPDEPAGCRGGQRDGSQTSVSFDCTVPAWVCARSAKTRPPALLPRVGTTSATGAVHSSGTRVRRSSASERAALLVALTRSAPRLASAETTSTEPVSVAAHDGKRGSRLSMHTSTRNVHWPASRSTSHDASPSAQWTTDAG